MVVVEKNIFNMTNLLTAIHSCFASYFVFNMIYPAPTKSMCVFLESVYGIKSTKKSLIIQCFLNSLSKVNI